MAAICCRTWCKTYSKRSQILSHRIIRCYSDRSVKSDDGLYQKVKKFVFGETVLPEQLRIEQTGQSESYYQLMEAKKPVLFNMELTEVEGKLESIARETIHMTDSQSWLLADTTDMVVKYKMLKSCYEEFGLAIPSHQLKDVKCVQDVLNHYRSLKKTNDKTFASLDMNNLPANLQIGGRVPRKKQ